MTKRISTKKISARQTYTAKELTVRLNFCEASILNWRKAGLPTVDSSRPYLFLGADVINFAKEKNNKWKCKLEPMEFFCVVCKKKTRSENGQVKFVEGLNTAFRMVGKCPVCNRTLNRTSNAEIARAHRDDEEPNRVHVPNEVR